ncbi:MAG TPA: hypothetical protein VFC53_11940 [Dehalococcoidia bacterium]|nr:hypothetical protein [Dehalococcoidia bacterium]
MAAGNSVPQGYPYAQREREINGTLDAMLDRALNGAAVCDATRARLRYVLSDNLRNQIPARELDKLIAAYQKPSGLWHEAVLLVRLRAMEVQS